MLDDEEFEGDCSENDILQDKHLVTNEMFTEHCFLLEKL